MSRPHVSERTPFGRVLTAMITPFRADGQVDLQAAGAVARYLVDRGNDGLIVSGTTGEGSTTSCEEDVAVLAAVLHAVGDDATVVANVGGNDTAESAQRARQAAAEGAHGLLVCAPYYNRPPQAGIVAHIRAVSDAGRLPIMIYDIPGRTGVEIARRTYETLAEDPSVVAVKDSVGDLDRGAWLLEDVGLKVYSGDDFLNFAWLTLGASGVVSVVGHAASSAYLDMVEAIERGDVFEARRIHLQLRPAVAAMMSRIPGAVAAKAALELLGVTANRITRLPLPSATPEEVAQLASGLQLAGLLPS
jgi:4-hydroxy-tetrahydrodipicolinate synthase